MSDAKKLVEQLADLDDGGSAFRSILSEDFQKKNAGDRATVRNVLNKQSEDWAIATFWAAKALKQAFEKLYDTYKDKVSTTERFLAKFRYEWRSSGSDKIDKDLDKVVNQAGRSEERAVIRKLLRLDLARRFYRSKVKKNSDYKFSTSDFQDFVLKSFEDTPISNSRSFDDFIESWARKSKQSADSLEKDGKDSSKDDSKYSKDSSGSSTSVSSPSQDDPYAKYLRELGVQTNLNFSPQGLGFKSSIGDSLNKMHDRIFKYFAYSLAMDNMTLSVISHATEVLKNIGIDEMIVRLKQLEDMTQRMAKIDDKGAIYSKGLAIQQDIRDLEGARTAISEMLNDDQNKLVQKFQQYLNAYPEIMSKVQKTPTTP